MNYIYSLSGELLGEWMISISFPLLGTVYGQGTYFARDASYSNGFARTDAQGLKHIYVVRVLTGEYTRGDSSMLVAPPKDPKDPTVLFDSVVDNTSNPSIYVVFYDADAYPEYLIVYK